jgi:uncharacterized membrane protein YqjE
VSRDGAGLLDAVTRVGASLFGIVQNRLELASLEVGEAGARLATTLVLGLAAVLLLGASVAALSAWVAVALWPALGAAVLAWLALAYAVAGAALSWWLRERLRRAPPLLADTLAELRRDAALMRGEGDAR